MWLASFKLSTTIPQSWGQINWVLDVLCVVVLVSSFTRWRQHQKGGSECMLADFCQAVLSSWEATTCFNRLHNLYQWTMKIKTALCICILIVQLYANASSSGSILLSHSVNKTFYLPPLLSAAHSLWETILRGPLREKPIVRRVSRPIEKDPVMEGLLRLKRKS